MGISHTFVVGNHAANSLAAAVAVLWGSSKVCFVLASRPEMAMTSKIDDQQSFGAWRTPGMAGHRFSTSIVAGLTSNAARGPWTMMLGGGMSRRKRNRGRGGLTRNTGDLITCGGRHAACCVSSRYSCRKDWPIGVSSLFENTRLDWTRMSAADSRYVGTVDAVGRLVVERRNVCRSSTSEVTLYLRGCQGWQRAPSYPVSVPLTTNMISG